MSVAVDLVREKKDKEEFDLLMDAKKIGKTDGDGPVDVDPEVLRLKEHDNDEATIGGE